MPAVTATTLALDATVYQLGNGASIGEWHGISKTQPIGFYGVATPVAQRATGNNTALTTGSTTTVQLAVLTEIQTTLVNLGMMPAT